jgi:hypothetical protein
MAQLVIQIPDNQLDRVLEALCAELPNVDSFTSGVTPTPALAKQVVINMIKTRVKMYEEAKQAKTIPPIDVSNIVS